MNELVWHTESLLVGLDAEGHLKYVVRKNGEILLHTTKKANFGEWELLTGADKVQKTQ